jgi:hypothetical protein
MSPKAASSKQVRAAKSSMSSEHKQALAEGREQSRAVRRYLDALEANKPKRGRRRSASGIEARLATIESAVDSADPLTRVHLIQERMDLIDELAAMGETVDMGELEAAFVEAAYAYGERKGISYTAWRSAGVDANVLRQAGVPRTRS